MVMQSTDAPEGAKPIPIGEPPFGAMPLLPVISTEERTTAELLAKSSLVPKEYQNNAPNIIAAAIHGSSIGLNIMQSLQSIAVINGKPSLYGDAALAIVQAHPDCQDVIEVEDAEGAECTVIRKGRSPVTRTFTIEDAKQAGLWGKQGPWTFYPKRMLQMRARSFALRDSFADALKGFELKEVVDDFVRDYRIPQPDEKGITAADTESNRPEHPVSRSQTLLEAIREQQPDNSASEPEAEDAAADQTEPEAALSAMILSIDTAADWEALRSLEDPCRELKNDLDPVQKGTLTRAFNAAVKELKG